jgi:8-oxo-dGTP pyrophosphatase MutT (NUDIX family)
LKKVIISFEKIFRKIVNLSQNSKTFPENMRQKYSRSTFLALYDAVAEKLLKHQPPIRIKNKDGSQSTTQLGLTWNPLDHADESNAACVILNDLVEKGFFKEKENFNFGKQLYNQRNKLDNDAALEEVTIQGKQYNIGLLKYLGYDSLAAFELDKAPPPLSDDPVTEAQVPASTEAEYTYYIGAYYSFRSYRVNKFVLAIQYTDQPTEPMNCWEWGFHSTERNMPINGILPKKINSARLSGTARAQGRHLFINLLADSKDAHAAREMHIIGICDGVNGENLEYQNAIPCSLQTVSFDKYTISLEAYLLRCSKAEADNLMSDPAVYFNNSIVADSLTSEQEESLNLYLMLQRRNFRVEFRPDAFNLDELEYRGNTVRRYTKRLMGEYRIWNFGLRRGVVVQSRLVISTEVPFQTKFYPFLPEDILKNDPELAEQLGVLVISNEIRRDQICFSTFVKRRLTLVNHAIFEIRNLHENNWAEGMFVTTGYDEKGIIGGYAVMCKVKPGERCEPCSMTRGEAEKYAIELGLKDMHDGLRKLWKRKLWKQKSNTQFGCYGIVRHPDKGILMVQKSNGPYANMYDLPGGKLNYGEMPEAALKRRYFEETGLDISQIQLMSNESAIWSWRRSDGIDESLHHIGGLYSAQSEENPDTVVLHPEAVWVHPSRAFAQNFSPFARKALEAF